MSWRGGNVIPTAISIWMKIIITIMAVVTMSTRLLRMSPSLVIITRAAIRGGLRRRLWVRIRDVNNQSGLIGLIDSNQSAHSIKPISRFFCINQANLKIFVDLLLS
jgi:hypothetical protein